MNKVKLLLLIFSFSFFCNVSFANKDSILKALRNPSLNEDTVKLLMYTRLIKVYMNNNSDSAIIFLSKANELSHKLKKTRLEATTYNYLGIVYTEQGNYSKSLEYYLKALKVWDERKDTTGRGMTNLNMANIFVRQNNYQRALECYDEIIRNQKSIKMPKVISAALINSASIFVARKDWKEALRRTEESLNQSKLIGDISGMGTCYSSIAMIAKENKEYEKSVDYFYKAIDVNIELNSPMGEGTERVNLSETFLRMKKYKEASQEAEKSLSISLQHNLKHVELSCYQVMADLYKTTKNFEKAFSYYDKYVTLKDSMFNKDKARELVEKEVAYEYGKKEALAKLEQEKKEEIAAVQSSRQKLFILFIGVVFIIVLFFSFMLIRRLKITNRQKLVIEQKNREITDSINYAKRLQDAILPQKETILSNLTEAFILYKPKDIVAGDFYFYEEEDGYKFVAVADCTGHGVPGAMVSVVCSNALMRCVKEFKIKDPALILDKAREMVLETFKRSGQDVKDGMDISFCVIPPTKDHILWAGANNALWYLNDGELKAIPSDKQPVGMYHNPMPFRSHKVILKPNDRFYLLTDGFADQFGGVNGKKFRGKALREVIINMASKSSYEQQVELESIFENWKGDLEQIDDVTILSFKLA